MSLDRHARLKTILLGAEGLTGADLARHLERECGDDADLRARAEALLAFDVDTRQVAPALHAARPTGPPVPPWRVGRWVAEREVGRGGAGTVFEGHDERSGERVAIKILHPHLVAGRDGEAALARFRREVALGRRIAHANVVRTIAAVDASIEGRTFHALVTEWVPGNTLRDLLAELDHVPEALVREIGRQVASGLSAVHAAGAVHRDVKPENVVLTADGRRACLMDLGVARIQAEATELTGDGEFVGSLAYAAPEQFGDGETDARADLHALGVVLLELVTGRSPFRRDSAAATVRATLEATPPRARTLAPEVSDFLDELIAALLEKDPDHRPASAREVVAAFEEGERGGWFRARSIARDAVAAAQGRAAIAPHVPVSRVAVMRGRDAELAALRAAWARAKAGAGAVVLVEGQAGLGKTRLVAELLREIAQGEGGRLYGAFPPTRGIGALLASVRPALGEPPANGLERLLPGEPTLARRIADWLDGSFTAEEPASGAGHALPAAMARLARALATSRPLAWVLDDIHFASDEAREAVREIAREAARAPLLLILTSRARQSETLKADLMGLEGFELLRLAPLGVADVASLVADEIGDAALAERLAGDVARRSDGIPFYVFELLRGLRESGVLVREGAAVRLGRPISDAPVPERVRELVEARLDDLSAEEGTTLDVAALQSTPFDPRVLARVLDEPLVTVLQRLARLERSRSLVRGEGGGFRFEHHLVREVVEARLPASLAEQYHGMIADAMVAEGTPERLRDRWRVARHRLLGPAPESATEDLSALVRALVAAHRPEQALELVDLALARSGLLEGERRYELAIRASEIVHVLGRRARERELGEEALVLARDLGDPAREARAHFALASLFVATRDDDAALAHARAGVRVAQRVDDADLMLDAALNLSVTLISHGRHEEARSLLDMVIERAAQAGRRKRHAIALQSRGLVALRDGRHAAARADFQAVLDMQRPAERGNPFEQAMGNLAVLDVLEGRREEAGSRFRRLLELARERGDVRMQAATRGHLGHVAVEDGCFADALRELGAERVLAEEAGDTALLVSSDAELAVVEAILGDAQAATSLREHLEARLPETRHPRLRAFVRTRCARVARLVGDEHRALEHLEESLRDEEARGDETSVAETSAELAGVLLTLGRMDDAARAARRSVEAAHAGQTPGPACLAHAVLAVLAMLTDGDETSRDEHVAASRERAERCGFPARLLAHALLWRATGDDARRDEARELLERAIGAAPPERRDAMRRGVALHRAILEHRPV